MQGFRKFGNLNLLNILNFLNFLNVPNKMNNDSSYRMQGFSFLPPVVKNLLILNALFFLADFTLKNLGFDLSDYLGLHYIRAEHYYPFQYLTYMFMHANFSHLFFNMFALWMFGYSLENLWGSKKFLFYYLLTGFGAGVIQTLAVGIDIMHVINEYGSVAGQHFMENSVTVGASGAVFGILLAFGWMFPNQMIYVYFFLPIKAKWFVIIYGLIELFAGISDTGGNVAHFAHLGGMLFGAALILIWRKQDRDRDNYRHFS